MDLVMKEAMEDILEKVLYEPDSWGSGSTDMGDITAVMPALHPLPSVMMRLMALMRRAVISLPDTSA